MILAEVCGNEMKPLCHMVSWWGCEFACNRALGFEKFQQEQGAASWHGMAWHGIAFLQQLMVLPSCNCCFKVWTVYISDTGSGPEVYAQDVHCWKLMYLVF